MSDPKARIDYGRISFPSDGITIGEVRRRSGKPDFTFEEWGHELDTLRYVEEGVVHLGFAAAMGDAHAVSAVLRRIGGEEGNRAGAESFLTDQYIRFGVADGPETAKQLFSRLEAMGSQQAKEQLGRLGTQAGHSP